MRIATIFSLTPLNLLRLFKQRLQNFRDYHLLIKILFPLFYTLRNYFKINPTFSIDVEGNTAFLSIIRTTNDAGTINWLHLIDDTKIPALHLRILFKHSLEEVYYVPTPDLTIPADDNSFFNGWAEVTTKEGGTISAPFKKGLNITEQPPLIFFDSDPDSLLKFICTISEHHKKLLQIQTDHHQEELLRLSKYSGNQDDPSALLKKIGNLESRNKIFETKYTTVCSTLEETRKLCATSKEYCDHLKKSNEDLAERLKACTEENLEFKQRLQHALDPTHSDQNSTGINWPLWNEDREPLGPRPWNRPSATVPIGNGGSTLTKQTPDTGIQNTEETSGPGQALAATGPSGDKLTESERESLKSRIAQLEAQRNRYQPIPTNQQNNFQRNNWRNRNDDRYKNDSAPQGRQHYDRPKFQQSSRDRRDDHHYDQQRSSRDDRRTDRRDYRRSRDDSRDRETSRRDRDNHHSSSSRDRKRPASPHDSGASLPAPKKNSVELQPPTNQEFLSSASKICQQLSEVSLKLDRNATEHQPPLKGPNDDFLSSANKIFQQLSDATQKLERTNPQAYIQPQFPVHYSQQFPNNGYYNGNVFPR